MFALSAPRAILRWTRQEELQQLPNVPLVPTRLRRGAVRRRAGPPDPVLPWRLRQPVAPVQSQHQLRGFLLHHTEAFKQGEQVHRLPRLLGVETSVFVGVCCGESDCVERWRMHVNVCTSVTRALFATGSFWPSKTMYTTMQVRQHCPKWIWILGSTSCFT